MLHILIAAALSAPQAAPPQAGQPAGSPGSTAPPLATGTARTPAKSSFQLLDRIEVVVNERVTTTLELQQDLRNATPGEGFLEELNEARVRRAHAMLEDQAGRDLGFDPATVERAIDRIERQNLDGQGGLDEAVDWLIERRVNSTVMREQIGRALYQNLWSEWQRGIQPGPGGRISRDRYIRPSLLRLAFEEQPRLLTIQQLILGYGPNAQPAQVEAVERQIEGMRQALENGADMDQMVIDYGRTDPETKGYAVVDEGKLRRAYPEVNAWLDSAEPGSLSEPVTYFGEEGPVGVMLLRFVEREGFTSYEVQDRLRREFQASLDQMRLNRGRMELLQAAYVYPNAAQSAPRSQALSAEP